MDTERLAVPNLGSMAKTFTKILRFRRAATGHGGGGGIAPDDDDSLQKIKFSKTNIDDFSTFFAEATGSDDLKVRDDQKPQQKLASTTLNREAMEALLANLFASVSAVKAAYAQLQVAQSPYDPETIQSADQAVVSELKRLSELKRCYLKRQNPLLDPHPAVSAQIQEQSSLLKTYQITTHKLESELQAKDAEILNLKASLLESEKHNNALEAKLHPGRTLLALDDLHHSGLNPTHFLSVLRYTVKSIRSFVKQMIKEMESAGWDLDVAATAIRLGVLRRKPGHRVFAFESYVCQKMFSDFQHRDFSLAGLEERALWDQRQFFDEFTKLKYLKPKEINSREAFPKFLRAKYLSLVHAKMEASFFGNLDHRALVSSGRGFPRTDFFASFAEMARRVWLLHCLFFSFGQETVEGSIFQAKKGSRFSEVYMENVAEDDGDEEDVAATTLSEQPPVVGFTVVPGFRVCRTVIQCRVYLSVSHSSNQSRRS